MPARNFIKKKTLLPFFFYYSFDFHPTTRRRDRRRSAKCNTITIIFISYNNILYSERGGEQRERGEDNAPAPRDYRVRIPESEHYIARARTLSIRRPRESRLLTPPFPTYIYPLSGTAARRMRRGPACKSRNINGQNYDRVSGGGGVVGRRDGEINHNFSPATVRRPRDPSLGAAAAAENSGDIARIYRCARACIYYL